MKTEEVKYEFVEHTQIGLIKETKASLLKSRSRIVYLSETNSHPTAQLTFLKIINDLTRSINQLARLTTKQK
jgi:hypothetical protein